MALSRSGIQNAKNHMDILKQFLPTVWQSADIQTLSSENPTTYTNKLRKRESTYCEESKNKKGKCVSETCLKYYSSPQNISYLPRDMGKMAMFDKNTTSNAVYKASKI